MRSLTVVITIGSGTVDRPVQTRQLGLVLQDSFCQRTSADVAEADHQYFHECKDRDLGYGPGCSRVCDLFTGGQCVAFIFLCILPLPL